MKLRDYKIIDGYTFSLIFEDGTNKVIDLSPLIQSKVSKSEVSTAQIDKEWGCLEFKDGSIDIEPKTLYIFANKQ